MTEDKLAWFRQARFGMFIHWGVYSIPARGEWVMYQEKIPAREYAPFADRFKPRRFNADEWVALAKEAGMKYMVLTTRHHDGFSLFDSRVSDFTSVKRAAGRDFIKEYVAACRKAGMRIGFYYSLLDWRFPAYFSGPKKDPKGWAKLIDYVHAQVRELCTNYGKIDVLWYDGGWTHDDKAWQSKKLNAMVRKLQPDILINDRSQLPEDFDTPEQHITPSKKGRMWESCMTMNDHWGYFKVDKLWKSAFTLVRNLGACVAGGGNYLLNVGPKPDGTIPLPSVVRLKEVGAWLRRNGESIYGAGPGPLEGATYGLSTAKGDEAYMHVHWWSGKVIRVPNVKVKVKSARILSDGRRVHFEKKGTALFLNDLPARLPDRPYPVIALMFEK